MSVRARVRGWLRRQRRRRAARRQHAPLREFVYLDDVSVYSLIASRLGPVAVEFTETETASLQSELSSTLGANVGVAKSELRSQLQTNQGHESQVLRKSIVQTTFKELYELEKDHLVLRPIRPDERLPKVRHTEHLRTLLPELGHPWAIRSSELTRGQLIELEVELETEPIFRISTVVSTMFEIMRESPDLAEMAGYEELGQVQSVGRVLEKLLAGLIPIRARVPDYAVINDGNDEWLIHRSILSQIQRPDVMIYPVSLVGIAEEALFWKDIRRVLFAHSRYRVLCRLGRSSIQDSWTPVKLTDVFKEVSPDIASSLEVLNRSAAAIGTTDAVGQGNEQYQTILRAAAVDYAEAILAHYGYEMPREELVRQAFVDEISVAAVEDIKERRRIFRVVTDHLQERFGFSVDPVVAAHLRTTALLDNGFSPDGHLASAPAGVVSTKSLEDERLLDVEFVAIYW